MRGTGRVVFAATMLLILGVVNIIYGIGALDDANYFVNDTRYILDNLREIEEVLREARMRHLVEQGRASRVPAWACVLSVLHGAGPSE